jgi:hypothetical protein
MNNNVLSDEKIIDNWLVECKEKGILPWEYDFKRILFRGDYDNENPIKHILETKNILYYRQKNDNGRKYTENQITDILEKKNIINFSDFHRDYYNGRNWESYMARAERGHIENYRIIEAVFQKIFPRQDSKKTYKDIMNSFWTTYKFLLQNEYPDIFTPKGSLGNNRPLSKNNETLSSQNKQTGNSYPPKDSWGYQVIPYKYLKYYENNFPNKIKIRGIDTWCEFLIQNFDYFTRVHQCDKLNKYAQLTHTIGNILTVPCNSNYKKGKYIYDYCDLGLKSLKDLLSPSCWGSFVKSHYLDEYVDENDNVIPLWKNHLVNSSLSPKDNGNQIPKESNQIHEFLSNVNCRIINRGKYLIKNLCEKTHRADYEFYKMHLRNLPIDPEFGDKLICTGTNKSTVNKSRKKD